MSSKTKKGRDYTGTLLRAYRPVECGEWLEKMTEDLWEIAGSSLDFYAKPTDEDESGFRLTIIGSGEFSIVRQKSQQLGSMCMKSVAKRARQEVSDSFNKPAEFKPNNIGIFRAHEGAQLALAFEHPQLDEERLGLATGIDYAARQWHRWMPNHIYSLRLASLAEHISPEVLEEMQTALPSAVPTLPGVVRPVLDPILLDANLG